MGAVMTWGFYKFGQGQRELQYVDESDIGAWKAIYEDNG
jgi:hypothetical protein